MNMLIALIDIIAAGFFLAAFVTAVRNYRMTRHDDTWLILSIAFLMASVWALFTSLEWFGLLSELFDEMQQPMLAATMGVFTAASIGCKFNFATPEE